MNDETKLLLTILLIPLALCMGFILGMWNAWWTLDVFNWFVVPYFGLKKITFWQMYGIMLTISCLKSTSRRKSKEGETLNWALVSIIGPMLIWCFALFVKGML